MIIFLGDIHSDFRFIRSLLDTNHVDDATIIQLGDFGIGLNPLYDSDTLLNLNSKLTEHNCQMYVIRGNHDDPFYFEGYHNYSNLSLLKDYTVLRLEDRNFLFVGGAVSIDRSSLMKQMQISASFGIHNPLYWKNEEFQYNEVFVNNLRDIDVVVTHTAPDWCHPDFYNGFGTLVGFYANQDETLEDDIKNERKMMSKMFDVLKQNKNPVTHHFYGHFHDHVKTVHNGTSHYLLDIKEIKELDHCLL